MIQLSRLGRGDAGYCSKTGGLGPPVRLSQAVYGCQAQLPRHQFYHDAEVNLRLCDDQMAAHQERVAPLRPSGAEEGV